MTPAIDALKATNIPHHLLEYTVDAQNGQEVSRDIGLAAAASLGVSETLVFKTLVVELAAGELVIAIIPVADKLNLKLLARAAGAKSAVMADPRHAERATGYVTGGISPLGQKRKHRTFLSDSASGLETIYISAGKRGLELALAPHDLISQTAAEVCPLTS